MEKKIESIKLFAREWINGKGRTPERKRLVIDVYQQLFNERLRVRCSTCFIEAIFRIINYKPMEKKCQFRLRKGAILQPFGGGIITNDNLTDEIAFECLRTHAANPSMFSVMPEIPMDDVKPELEIVPPDDETTVEQIAGDPESEQEQEPEIIHEQVVDVQTDQIDPSETKPADPEQEQKPKPEPKQAKPKSRSRSQKNRKK